MKMVMAGSHMNLFKSGAKYLTKYWKTTQNTRVSIKRYNPYACEYIKVINHSGVGTKSV